MKKSATFSATPTPSNSNLKPGSAHNRATVTTHVARKENKEDPVVKKQLEKSRLVTNFATKSYFMMVNNVTTSKYIADRKLASSSTFPLRLLANLNKNPWRAAPFMPVPDRDLSCYYGIPPYREPLDYDPDTTPVNISADEVSGSIDSTVTYSGNIVITQGDKALHSDLLTYDSSKGYAKTEGNLLYQGPEVTISSKKSLEADLNQRTLNFSEPEFQLNGSVARGSSQNIAFNDNSKTALISDLEFSTCPAGDNSWYLRSEKVELVQDEAFGNAYNTTLYIKDVPVMYLPYINFPISNQRKSGLLYPEFSIGTENGLDYTQPIYFNIAPNYDYTLTPRLMTQRGLLLGNEFRYMPWQHTTGMIEFDYIFKDDSWDLAHNFDQDYRYFLRLKQESKFYHDDLTINLDYQRVRNNDYDYLNDIGADSTSVTDDHLTQSLKASFDQPDYRLSIEARDYQSLQPEEVIQFSPFAMMPQIKAEYYDTFGAVTLNLNAEATRFQNNSSSFIRNFDAERYHLEPALDLQMFNSRGTSVNASARGFLTHYNQDSIDNMPLYFRNNMGFSQLDSSTTRALYMLQLHGKTTLERKVLDLRHTQTLEPEIQYQYIPYKNQNNIAIYDTTDRMNDYYSNFSFRQFTGKDRIADVNTLTVGLTSRLLDAHDRELMRVGISQAYSFVPTRVTLNPKDPENLYPRSPLSMFFNASPMEGMSTHASITYTNETNKITSWNAMAQYRNESGLLMQVSYRFAIDGNRTISNNIIDLRQIGVLTEIPLSSNFTLGLASYRDLEQNENIDTKLTLKYEECCWSLAFVYENYNSCDWDDLTREEDHRIGISFEFKGVGAINITGDADDSLTNTHLLDYFDPTNLNR